MRKCRKHPEYKAMRRPKAPCAACWDMWDAARPRKAYMCGVAWQHEVGETDVKTYGSLRELRHAQECTGTCGIVEVEVRLKRWVRKQRME